MTRQLQTKLRQVSLLIIDELGLAPFAMMRLTGLIR
jgi:DNA replication protein DnaC